METARTGAGTLGPATRSISDGQTQRSTALQRAFNPVVRRRSGAAIALSGARGIGKSMQASRLLCELPCQTLSMPAATPVTQLATELLENFPVAGWVKSALANLATGDELPPFRAPAVLGACLSALAPFVLHLDDLNAADETTLSFVSQLAQAIKSHPGAGLLVTTRGPLGRPFKNLRAEPLGREESDELLELELSASVPEAASSWIFARAAGNPLFTREYLRHLTRQGFLWSDGERWHWRQPNDMFLPTTVEALIDEVVSDVRNEPLLRDVLEARALLHHQATTAGLWRHVAGVNRAEMQRAVRILGSRGVLTDDDFSHPLYREVVLASINLSRLRDLSRRAIQGLGNDLLGATQYVRWAELSESQSLDLLLSAAHACTNAISASRLIASAVDFATGARRGELALEAAQGLCKVDYTEATRLATIATEELSEPANGSPESSKPSKSTQSRTVLAELLALQGRGPEAGRVIEGLPAPLRQGTMAHVFALLGSHREVLQAAEGLDHRALNPRLGAEIATAHFECGDYDAAEQLAIATLNSAALANAQSADHIQPLHAVLANIAHLKGRFDEAAALLTSAIEALRLDGPSAALAATLQSRADVRQSLGDLRGKRDDIEAAISIYEALGDGKNVAATRVRLGVLLLEEGEHSLAEEVLLASRETLERLGAKAQLVNCERMLCYLYRQLELPFGTVLARKYGNRALQRARELNTPQLLADTLYEASYAESLAGFPEYGLALAEEGLSLCAMLQYSQVRIYALFARAFAHEKLGDQERALRDYGAAAEEAWLLGLTMDAQTMGLELDRLTGDADAARRRQDWFEANGHPRRAQMVDEYFPEVAKVREESVEPAPMMRLELLGPTRLGATAAVRPVSGRKRMRLLGVLLEARITGRREVPRLALIETLYPEKDEIRAAACLKELVHDLRVAVGTNLVITTSNGYALGACESDVEQFLDSLDTSLWRGPYASGIELPDGPVRESLYLSLRGRAEALLGDDPRETARVGKLLLEADPYDLVALQLYLSALRKLGNHRTLGRQYQAAKASFHEVGEELPEHWQDYLLRRLTPES